MEISKIIYRPAGRFTKQELSDWLQKLPENDFHPVFVGLPAPDFPAITTLPEAYKIFKEFQYESVLGGVTIPERHNALKDEDRRILQKMNDGVSYFISQCIFNVDYAKQVITDLSDACKGRNVKLPTIIFTLSVCGSTKTLSFMEWLGIHLPDELKDELKASENILEKSIDVCLKIAAELTEFCSLRTFPFGFNIESVAIRKEEIEASIHLTRQIAAMLEQKGIRKSIAKKS